MNDYRIRIVRKIDLNQPQLDILDHATAAAGSEPGPSSVWHMPACLDKLRAIVLESTHTPIGLFHVGGPPEAIDVGWWIRSEYRGQGYCSEALALLADTLKAEGVTGLAKILILDADYKRSHCLLQAFVKRFYATGVEECRT
jgi:hypothetical protein